MFTMLKMFSYATGLVLHSLHKDTDNGVELGIKFPFVFNSRRILKVERTCIAVESAMQQCP